MSLLIRPLSLILYVIVLTVHCSSWLKYVRFFTSDSGSNNVPIARALESAAAGGGAFEASNSHVPCYCHLIGRLVVVGQTELGIPTRDVRLVVDDTLTAQPAPPALQLNGWDLGPSDIIAEAEDELVVMEDPLDDHQDFEPLDEESCGNIDPEGPNPTALACKKVVADKHPP